jgi:glycosyltransferase involved in cell wall biosynthesis
VSSYPSLAALSRSLAAGASVSASDGAVSTAGMRERFAGRLAIVIPAYEEQDSLAELLPRIPASVCGLPAAVLVVDDGSTDGTSAAASVGGAVVVRLAANAGGGAALRVGYGLVVDAGAEIVVTMDADGQHRPEDLEQLVEPVRSGRALLAQGSRTLGRADGGVFVRELGISVFNRLIGILTRTRVTDCSNGLRAVRAELLAELELRQRQFHAAELLIEAITRGATIEEVPVTVLPRRHGASKKPPALSYGAGVGRAIVSTWLRSLRRRRAARCRDPAPQVLPADPPAR